MYNTHMPFFDVLYPRPQASIMRQTSPEEAYRRFDELAQRHVETLRKLTNQIQSARNQRDSEANKHDAIKRAIHEYDEALETYIPGGLQCICWRM